MPTTRKSTTKSTKIAPRKKSGKATAAPPPNSDTAAPVDTAAVAVAALQTQIVARDNALESHGQERRITQVTAMHAGGNVATNSRAEIASGSNVNLDEADGTEDGRTSDVHIRQPSPNVYWKHQDPHKPLEISTLVIKVLPYLNNLQPPS
ncbi:hypothetical protein RSOL_306140, partial [Rhizoctonia solani AG-3 Rhs1AP]